MSLSGTLITALIGARVAGGMVAVRLGFCRDLASRLSDFPTDRLPLSRPVTIHWDGHQIPFIEADSDTDAAFALGMVHAHLRLAQIEAMRRLALGRTAEMLGPAALPMDLGLRMIDFARAVPAIIKRMPAWTLAWTEAFAAGITHYAARTPRLPPEFAMLGLTPERWTAADVVTVGRLASADVNWVILFNLLRLRPRADWPALWAGLADHEGASPVPLVEDDRSLGRIATAATRAGSNAVAVAGWRSTSGGALMAADPHLSITLPNLWLAAGLKCPSLHACGLMVPGLPFFAIGRNPVAAWSGTSLQATSSDLFDASRLPSHGRRVTLRARGASAIRADIRETALGPVISDSLLVPSSTPVALKWMGHRPSDEISAWLAVARATSWQEFSAAADGMAIPGHNLVWADAGGHVGKLLAAHLPFRPNAPIRDPVLSPDEAGHWDRIVTASDLPSMVDPPGGVVASANEGPRHAGMRVGLFFPGHQRYLRLHRLAHTEHRIGLDDLATLQLDVHSESAADLKGWLARRLVGHPVADVLDAWDGTYGTCSVGAAAFERLLGRLYDFAHGDCGMAAYWASWNPATLLTRRLAEADTDALARVLDHAAADVAETSPAWGELHRLRLTHTLGILPGLDRICRFADMAAPGGNDTINKTAHGISGDTRHGVRFGANARFLADLGDPDATRVVLLGGQDGWPGSSTFLDQVELWRDGGAIGLPLRPETVRATFPHRIVLRP